jgi:hypothetical protein
MTTPPRFSVETVRAAARKAVADSSLREVADQIPMTWTGLRKFINGGNPHRATADKLVGWFLRTRRGGIERFDRSEIDAAVALLTRYVAAGADEPAREKRRREIAKRLGT